MIYKIKTDFSQNHGFELMSINLPASKLEEVQNGIIPEEVIWMNPRTFHFMEEEQEEMENEIDGESTIYFEKSFNDFQEGKYRGEYFLADDTILSV